MICALAHHNPNADDNHVNNGNITAADTAPAADAVPAVDNSYIVNDPAFA